MYLIISKIVAQLTKIVFRLHADSLDNKDKAIELKNSYEKELLPIKDVSKMNILG